MNVVPFGGCEKNPPRHKMPQMIEIQLPGDTTLYTDGIQKMFSQKPSIIKTFQIIT